MEEEDKKQENKEQKSKEQEIKKEDVPKKEEVKEEVKETTKALEKKPSFVTPSAKATEVKKTTDDKEEPKKVKVPAKFKSLVEEIEKMSVLDLSELVKILEDKFGVSAAAPMVMGAMPGGADANAGAVDEKTSFDVELTETGGNKIAVIKAIRSFITLGLKEAKDIADTAPKMVLEGVDKEKSEEAKKALEEAGAKVTLK